MPGVILRQSAPVDALSSVRLSYISEIETILLDNNSLLIVKSVIKDKFIFTCTSVITARRVVLCPQESHRVEAISRRLCFSAPFETV